MSVATPGFEGLRITNYWKYLLYLSGVVLILSMFVPAQEVSNTYIRKIAFDITLGGLVIWAFHSFTHKIGTWYEYYSGNQLSDGNVFGLIIVNYIVQGVAWFIIFKRYF